MLAAYKKRIYKTALITSPIMGIYGVSPFYLFLKITIIDFLEISVSLTCFAFVYWIANILVLNITPENKAWMRYVLSYTFTMLLQSIFIILGQRTGSAPQAIDAQFSLSPNLLAYPIITSLAINTIILIIIQSITVEHKRKVAELEVVTLKASNLEAQKQMLIQQLQPHFLFNALSTLKSLIRDKPKEAENYSVKLSSFLRYGIKAHQNYWVPLEEELAFTKDYVEMQKVRFGDSFSCQIAIPDSLFYSKIPTYALQTLVENAIKHNSFTERKPLLIKIDLVDHCLRVWNNKLALIKIESESSGTGLTNLNERYKLLTGKEIKIEEGDDYFCVSFELMP